jgi:hypothetical protein
MKLNPFMKPEDPEKYTSNTPAKRPITGTTAYTQ